MTPETTPTRARILESSLELFSEQGFDRTSVGDIEEAAGLARRSGGFYRHFDSKRDVLEAVIDRQVEENKRLNRALEVFPLGDLESEIKLLLKSGMDLIERGHKIYLSLLPLADEYPGLFERMHTEVVCNAYETVEKWADAKREQGIEFSGELEVLGLIANHALVQYKQEQTLFDELPAGVDEDEYLETLAELILGAIETD